MAVASNGRKARKKRMALVGSARQHEKAKWHQAVVTSAATTNGQKMAPHVAQQRRLSAEKRRQKR